MSTDSPLIVFVHTPKAAGSTVIGALESIGPGKGHMESLRKDEKAFLQTATSSTWISGHIAINEFKRRLAPLDRPVRYFTAMREPTAQVMSHYNWLIEIYFKGDKFYQNHPEAIKRISKRLRDSDRSKPAVVVANLRKHPRLFLNFQSRFVLGHDFAESEVGIDEALDTYDFISDGTDVDALLDAMSSGLTSERRRNVSRYHFDPRVFRRPAVKRFLTNSNNEDEQLYERLRERKGSAT